MSQKKLKCDKCKKMFDDIWLFTPYGGEERKRECEKNTQYCEACFSKKELEISKNMILLMGKEN